VDLVSQVQAQYQAIPVIQEFRVQVDILEYPVTQVIQEFPEPQVLQDIQVINTLPHLQQFLLLVMQGL
jgi:hypothetical protein